MTRHHPSRFVGALLALIGMLFMQLAVAGYVCPGVNPGQRDSISVASATQGMQSMAGCEGMDMQQPALCHAYAQDGKQTLDKPDLPAVQPFIPAGLSLVVQVLDDHDDPAAAALPGDLLARATAPPLPIRNCCFRI